MRYRVITENNKVLKRFETERQAENYWNNFNGVYTDDNGNEERIYIEDMDEYVDYCFDDEA